jgi:hypothetical protein
MGPFNWIRAKAGRPIRFDEDRALSEARHAAHNDLARLGQLPVRDLIALDEAELVGDPLTDGIACNHEGEV